MRDVMLMVHFLGLAMSVGTAFTQMFLGMSMATMEPAERASMGLRTLKLRRLGQTGLALLVLSGGSLMTPYWSTLSNNPLLVAKLSLVVLLIVMVVAIDRLATKAERGDRSVLPKIRPIGMTALATAVVVVVLAVSVFH